MMRSTTTSRTLSVDIWTFSLPPWHGRMHIGQTILSHVSPSRKPIGHRPDAERHTAKTPKRRKVEVSRRPAAKAAKAQSVSSPSASEETYSPEDSSFSEEVCIAGVLPFGTALMTSESSPLDIR
jgi:hypothetical protein